MITAEPLSDNRDYSILPNHQPLFPNDASPIDIEKQTAMGSRTDVSSRRVSQQCSDSPPFADAEPLAQGDVQHLRCLHTAEPPS